MPYSIAILSIPAYYCLAIYPHFEAVKISGNGDVSRHDNRNPKSTQHVEKIRKFLSPRQFAAYERAERCHTNNLENMPLFVAALLAGLLADQMQKAGLNGSLGLGTTSLMLNEFALAWLLVRTLYTAAYLKIETKKLSYLRSLCYFIGVGLCFAELIQAAKVLV
ncbi:hypothetical protein K431DRAFT_320296 [Polychaeton citri CBS 116435]|uniref:MAPEG family protein n=1 Tax=Polychaeton citri CBS 116435 TaxID=1314669 RepID=A0A9P4UQ97_9PEZI|nr:hypothetical protein K431DRAFT_320296 [Polychaeton citri CBS 116435]